MDITNDARRLATIGTFFITVGWVGIIYTLIAAVLWWIDIAQREAFNIFEAFIISSYQAALPVFAAFLVGGVGYFLRLFALYVANRSQ
jgi:hypothetical protein